MIFTLWLSCGARSTALAFWVLHATIRAKKKKIDFHNGSEAKSILEEEAEF